MREESEPPLEVAPPILVFGDLLFCFETVREAETYFEQWYYEKVVQAVYDREGCFYKFVQDKPKSFWSKPTSYQLKKVDCEQINKLRLRSELISYLLYDPRYSSHADQSLFSLSLDELISMVRPFCDNYTPKATD